MVRNFAPSKAIEYFCRGKKLKTMKYFKLFLGVTITIFVLWVYVFIPNKIIVTKTTFVHQSGNWVTNGFMQIQYWDKWMPHQSIQKNTFIFKQGKLEVHESFLSAIKCFYTLNEMSGPVTYSAIDAGGDSTLMRYEAKIDNRILSPLKRIQNYADSKKMKLQLDATLMAAANFYSKKENIKIDTLP